MKFKNKNHQAVFNGEAHKMNRQDDVKMAVLYLLKKKAWCLTGIFYMAFVAGCVAALPVVIQSDVKVIPNVMGTIVLMTESLAAKLVMKKQPEEKAKNKNDGRRLERH